MKTKESSGIVQRGKAYFILDPDTGEWLELKGYGSMKGTLDLDPRIDLTKPIYEQVLTLERKDRAREARLKASTRKASVPA